MTPIQSRRGFVVDWVGKYYKTSMENAKNPRASSRRWSNGAQPDPLILERNRQL